MASDSQIKQELAIKELGIRLSLKDFCASQIKTSVNDEREQKKQRLISELIEGKKDKAKVSSKTKKAELKKPEPKVANRNIMMGWIHNGVRVGLDKGGGTREMKVPVNYCYRQLIEAGENWFFPDGQSSFGNIIDMNVGLADFKRQTLKETVGDLQFTLGDYADKNGFKSRVRLYFTSEKNDERSLSPSMSDEDDFLPGPFSTLTSKNESDENYTSQPKTSTISDLMGTTQERLELREEQDKAYIESLNVDSRKLEERRQVLQNEVQEVTRQENLRSQRAQRVQEEPNIEEEHVIILVRHLTLGTVSRMFLTNSTMNQVYDWVGSLNLLPEHFRLVFPVSGAIVLPEMPIVEAANCVLNMSECEEPLSLVHDDSDISAVGFSEGADLSVESMISKVPEFLPDKFMEEDENEMGIVSTNKLL